jgi:hypothetical protein
MSKTIKDLINECHQNSVNKGFWAVNHDIGCKLMLVNTELVEMFERVRKNQMTVADEHCPKYPNAKVEGADAVIRLFDLFGYLGWTDMQEVIEEKMAFNAGREYLHGKQF